MIQRRRFLQYMASTTAVICCPIDVAGAAGPAVARRPTHKPPLTTGDSVDPRFNKPYIDLEEWRDVPGQAPATSEYTTQQQEPTAERARHYYVHGGFTGTDAKFSFTFPPPEKYQERFFQPTHQLTLSELAPARTVAMALAAGAYLVQTNMGGSEMARTAEANMVPGYDGDIGSYRVNAESAKYSRVVAARLYKRQHRPFGYLYGGSGGAYQVVAGAQNTRGVWDGFVPYVMGNPSTTTAHFLVRAHALRVLKDKWPSVMDAVEPGGSGNPYAGLNAEEKLALEEATAYGFPPRAWFNYVPAGIGPLRNVAAYVPLLDPSYDDDFWSKPGYITPESSVRAARTKVTATIVRVIPPPEPVPVRGGPPMQLELSNVPVMEITSVDLIRRSGEGIGQSVPLESAKGNMVTLGSGAEQAIWRLFKVGDTVEIDNSAYLALQTYYRHALPEHRSVFDYPPIFDSFRNANGTPKYPQRAININLGQGFGDIGITQGAINGKMIVVQCLMDGDALPAEADWYAGHVRKTLGAKFNDNYRIWYTDNAQHTAPTTAQLQKHVVSYLGALDQALRDVAAWAEKRVAPPPSTNYKVVKGQVQVPPDAASRRGIQPVVDLKANGAVRTEVATGQPVAFTVKIDLPPNTGSIVAADWDFEGLGTYAQPAVLSNTTSRSVTLTATHSYARPGTYFAAIRATSNREGDAKTAYNRVQNLGRVRVVVK